MSWLPGPDIVGPSLAAEPVQVSPRSTRRSGPSDGDDSRFPAGALAQKDKTGKKRAAADSPQRVVRPTVPVPQHDLKRLEELGIRRYESQRLVLYTDLAPELAQPLPPLMDQAYAAWEDYFGPLPADSGETPFQMIGYIMSDRALFREAGILTDDIRIHLEGVFRRQVFWMNDQPLDYDRRHLMIHEGTHCFMVAFPNITNRHIWYMEGMADLFRTHTTDANGRSQFRVFPTDRQRFTGLGRTKVIEEEVRSRGPRRIEDVATLTVNDFQNYDAYSWSWALCAFLDGHPKYRERFRRMGGLVVGRNDLPLDLSQVFKQDWPEVSEEWLVFAGNVGYGYDIERTVLDLRPGKVADPQGKPAQTDVAANRGWQNSGVLVEKGKTYRLQAAGKCVLAKEPKPWDSEPQGISFRYHGGQPLGKLLATIRSASPEKKPPYTTMLQVMPIGRELQLTPDTTGTLYFRVNDFWNELGDNQGSYSVTIHREP
ncbi:MAG: hypothetical protein JSS02_27265 [Planctomycetes bacterium]|nr:hypothetical protein [Planctomycetota bacterium]